MDRHRSASGGGVIMAQTKIGAARVLARKAGLSLEAYLRRCVTHKYCWRCKLMQARASFAIDRSRHDGLVASCRTSTNDASRKHYTPTLKPRRRHVWIKSGRDGDKKQARRRVNYLVERGRIPRPDALPCTDCGQRWKRGLPRHEYDHHKGYAAKHHLDVQAVCRPCHDARST